MKNQNIENFTYKGFKFSLSFVESHGLPASRLNYQWRNKYVRKTFTHDINGDQARKYAKAFVDSQNIGFDGLEDLAPETIADIKSALAILPKGESLSAIVSDFVRNKATIDLNFVKSFIETKKGKTAKFQAEATSLITKLIEYANGKYDRDTLIRFISKKKAPKTRSNVAGILSNFFKFAVRRDVIAMNPFDKITPDDFGGSVARDSIPEVATITQATELIAYLRAYRPQFLKHFILALFGGIRIAECERITPDLIDIGRREISFPKKIVKGKIKAFIISDYPQVLFDWLAILEGAHVQRPNNATRTAIGKALNLPPNFARHSFATYHLSLHHDFKLTARLTRHLSVSTLENNYIGSMVKKEVAEEFFSLTPDTIAKWSQNNAKRLEIIADDVKRYLYLARKKKTR